MNGPGLQNPFENLSGESPRTGTRKPASKDHPNTSLDAAIEQALRSEPLAPPPPLLYAAVMRSVRADLHPRFRLRWLDLALSLFAAAMPPAIWWALRSLPRIWLDYLRLEAVYHFNMLWLLNFPLVVWSALAAAMLLVCIAAIALLRPKRFA